MCTFQSTINPTSSILVVKLKRYNKLLQRYLSLQLPLATTAFSHNCISETMSTFVPPVRPQDASTFVPPVKPQDAPTPSRNQSLSNRKRTYNSDSEDEDLEGLCANFSLCFGAVYTEEGCTKHVDERAKEVTSVLALPCTVHSLDEFVTFVEDQSADAVLDELADKSGVHNIFIRDGKKFRKLRFSDFCSGTVLILAWGATNGNGDLLAWGTRKKVKRARRQANEDITINIRERAFESRSHSGFKIIHVGHLTRKEVCFKALLELLKEAYSGGASRGAMSEAAVFFSFTPKQLKLSELTADGDMVFKKQLQDRKEKELQVCFGGGTNPCPSAKDKAQLRLETENQVRAAVEEVFQTESHPWYHGVTVAHCNVIVNYLSQPKQQKRLNAFCQGADLLVAIPWGQGTFAEAPEKGKYPPKDGKMQAKPEPMAKKSNDKTVVHTIHFEKTKVEMLSDLMALYKSYEESSLPPDVKERLKSEVVGKMTNLSNAE
jgi:hypothetical protein